MNALEIIFLYYMHPHTYTQAHTYKTHIYLYDVKDIIQIQSLDGQDGNEAKKKLIMHFTLTNVRRVYYAIKLLKYF